MVETIKNIGAKLDGAIECDLPNKFINSFTGCLTRKSGEKHGLGAKNFLLRDSVLRNTQWAIGVVVYTGQETKVMMNNTVTPSKMSHLESVCNSTLYVVVLTQCILVTATVLAKEVFELTFMQDKGSFWYLYPDGNASSTYILPNWAASWFA